MKAPGSQETIPRTTHGQVAKNLTRGSRLSAGPLARQQGFMGIAIAFLMGFAVAPASVDSAQIGYLWSFDELTAKADFVIIAGHVTTEDTGRRTDHPRLKPPLLVVELETVFNVFVALKLDAQGRSASSARVRLKHYHIDWEAWRRSIPAQPGVPPPGILNTGSMLDFSKDTGPYLLFLRRSSGEVYEPLSGHTFPTASVYLLRKLGSSP